MFFTRCIPSSTMKALRWKCMGFQCSVYLAEILLIVEVTYRTRGTFALVHAMKAYKGFETAPAPRNLGINPRWTVSWQPRPLYHRSKSSRFPLSRRLVGSPSQFTLFGKENNTLPLLGVEPDRPSSSLVMGCSS